MKSSRRGLTLIELLIVISILSILLALLLPNFNDVRKQARDRRRKADLRAIQQALELYRTNQSPQSYPTSLPSPGETFTDDSDITYMRKTPADPLSTTDYVYRYTPVDSNRYYLGACLENPADSDIVITPPVPTGATGWGTCANDRWYAVYEP